MITYNALDLFSTGPSAIEPGPLQGRDAIADSPNAIGASAITQGTQPRKLTQRGTLVADDPEAMQALTDAIQAQIGAGAFELIDQHAKAWPDCLMQRFEPGALNRLGPRVAADYEITYLQTHP